MQNNNQILHELLHSNKYILNKTCEILTIIKNINQQDNNIEDIVKLNKDILHNAFDNMTKIKDILNIIDLDKINELSYTPPYVANNSIEEKLDIINSKLNYILSSITEFKINIDTKITNLNNIFQNFDPSKIIKSTKTSLMSLHRNYELIIKNNCFLIIKNIKEILHDKIIYLLSNYDILNCDNISMNT